MANLPPIPKAFQKDSALVRWFQDVVNRIQAAADSADVAAHTTAANPHTGSASTASLTAHTGAANPHSGSLSTASQAQTTSEIACGKTWTGAEVVYRKVVSTGTLPNAATTSTAHGITGLSRIISITGYAWNGSLGITLPAINAGAAGNNVGIEWNTTNVILRTAQNLSAYTESYVVLEYTKT